MGYVRDKGAPRLDESRVLAGGIILELFQGSNWFQDVINFDRLSHPNVNGT